MALMKIQTEIWVEVKVIADEILTDDSDSVESDDDNMILVITKAILNDKNVVHVRLDDHLIWYDVNTHG